MTFHAVRDLGDADDAAGFKGARQIGNAVVAFDVGECIGRRVEFALAGVDEDGAAQFCRPNPCQNRLLPNGIDSRKAYCPWRFEKRCRRESALVTAKAGVAIHLRMFGSLFAACRNVSVGICVYCLDTVGESWPMNSRVMASDTPAALSRVVAVCRSE